MPKLLDKLSLPRCPHCGIAHPDLSSIASKETRAHDNTNPRIWRLYVCSNCGGVVVASANSGTSDVREIYPSPLTIDTSLPQKVKAFLEQATSSYHAPSGAIMLAASAVDAMLKSKDYKEGNLYKRIEKAAKDHLITEGMSKWAHQIRLDANDERHADDAAELPTTHDAKRTVEFALALAEFLFVLPERVTRGLAETEKNNKPEMKRGNPSGQ